MDMADSAAVRLVRDAPDLGLSAAMCGHSARTRLRFVPVMGVGSLPGCEESAMATRTRRSPGDGSIFQRSDGRYIGRLVVDGRRLQVSDTTRRGAVLKLGELRRRIER